MIWPDWVVLYQDPQSNTQKRQALGTFTTSYRWSIDLYKVSLVPLHISVQWGGGDGEWLSEDIFTLDGVETIHESDCNTRKVCLIIVKQPYIAAKLTPIPDNYRKKTSESVITHAAFLWRVSIYQAEWKWLHRYNLGEPCGIIRDLSELFQQIINA